MPIFSLAIAVLCVTVSVSVEHPIRLVRIFRSVFLMNRIDLLLTHLSEECVETARVHVRPYVMGWTIFNQDNR